MADECHIAPQNSSTSAPEFPISFKSVESLVSFYFNFFCWKLHFLDIKANVINLILI